MPYSLDFMVLTSTVTISFEQSHSISLIAPNSDMEEELYDN